jgi:hypothetical protein
MSRRTSKTMIDRDLLRKMCGKVQDEKTREVMLKALASDQIFDLIGESYEMSRDVIRAFLRFSNKADDDLSDKEVLFVGLNAIMQSMVWIGAAALREREDIVPNLGGLIEELNDNAIFLINDQGPKLHDVAESIVVGVRSDIHAMSCTDVKQVQVNDLVQVNPAVVGCGGAILVVSAVFETGVKAYTRVVGEPKANQVANVELTWDQFRVVGNAAWRAIQSREAVM